MLSACGYKLRAEIRPENAGVGALAFSTFRPNCPIACAVTVLYPWVSPLSQNDKTHKNCAAESYINSLELAIPQKQNEAKDTIKAPDKKADSFKNMTDCSGLKAQWRMTDIAQKGYYAGIAGMILLLTTLFETLRAGRELTRQTELNRAWILVDRIETNHITNPRTGEEITVFKIKIINSGKHHASNVRVSRNFFLYKVDEDFPRYEEAMTNNSTAVIPQDREVTATDIVLDRAKTKLVSSREHSVAIFCKVTYLDGFSKETRITTAAFRSVFMGQQSMDGVYKPLFQFEPTGEQNQAT